MCVSCFSALVNALTAQSRLWHDLGVSGRIPGWQSWLDTLGQSDRDAARWLRTQFETLGADDPESWARSQIEEGLPHLARYMLLRSLWAGCIDSWSGPDALEQVPAAARLLAAGADRVDLVRLARAAAYEAVFAVLGTVDEGTDVNVSGIDAGWVLVETGEDGSATSRVLSGLHEELLSMDPDGRDGADMRE